MKGVPKSLRLQIGIFGRANVGKSSFLNKITSQDVSIVSPKPGTTTDVVEKVMEFGPVGPAVFLDTAGVDDNSDLSSARVGRTEAVFKRADVFVVVTEEGRWGDYEMRLAEEARKRGAPLAAVVNKTDINPLSDEFRGKLLEVTPRVMGCSCVGGKDGGGDADDAVEAFRRIMTDCAVIIQDRPRSLVNDLIPPNGLVILIIPIDKGAPKGRLILPQSHAISDILCGGGIALTVRESEYADALAAVNRKPDLVVCDSQVVKFMVDNTPRDVACTTFSILFARLKGGFAECADGAAAIGRLKAGDKVLIAEACSHHASDDDIGRVKIPRWLKEYTGAELSIDFCNGRDYPNGLGEYALVIHCGGCMLTGREMSARVREAGDMGVPVTNYGMAISYMQGVFERVMEPFGEINVR